MHTAFTLAGVTIALETPRPVSVMDNFRPFCGESGGETPAGTGGEPVV